MIGIYKITSPSDKVYIGQSWNIKKRISNYKCLDCKRQPKLCNSLCKYGPENHKFEVVCELEPDANQHQLDQQEQFFMNIYKLEGIELMNIRGAGSRGKYNEETRLKISLSHKGKKHSAERILKNKLSHIGLKQSEETKRKRSLLMQGHVVSETTRKKIGDSNRGNTCYSLGRTIIQYENEIPIKTWYSMREASRELNINLSCIVKVCRGKKLNVKGYVFKYKDAL